LINSVQLNKIGNLVECVSELLSHQSNQVVDKSYTFLNSKLVVDELQKNSETSLDLLEVLKTLPEPSSLSIKLQKVLLKTNCLNALLVQDDWAWFFGDTSEYVSIFVEATEAIFALANPAEIEDSRLTACKCLQALLLSFNIRKIRGKMTPILQYGVVNCMNATLTLLQDEDVDVRNAATNFASKLKRSCLLPQACEINTILGVQAVIYFALSELTEVIEMFNPASSIINLTYLPTQVTSSLRHKQLFKKGDGINVYEEPVFMMKLFMECVKKFCSVGEDNQLNVVVHYDITKIDHFLTIVQEHTVSQDLYTMQDWTEGREGLLKLSAFIQLLIQENFCKNSPAEVERLNQIQNLLHDFISKLLF